MSNILTILKKELKRFFTDKRMVFSLIFPGILMYVMYSLMGAFLFSDSTAEDYTYQVYVVNNPQQFSNLFEIEGYDIYIEDIEESQIDEIKELISEEEADLLVVYDEYFYENMESGLTPQVAIYKNSISSTSSEMYQIYTSVLELYESSLTNLFDVVIEEDLANDEDISAMLLSSMVPLLLMTFLFSGCMAIAAESIAGDKERGIMATLLVTPTKRSDIAIGKIVALSLTSLVSATSSFLGILLSLPNLFGDDLNLSISMYSTGDFAILFLLIIVVDMLFIIILSILSTLAKTVKESQQYAMPLMVLVLVCGLSPMILSGITSQVVYYIPIINVVTCFTDIFGLSINYYGVIVTLIVNSLLAVVGIFVLSKMFNNEKIMFN